MWTIAAVALGALAYWMDTWAVKIKARHAWQAHCTCPPQSILNAETLHDLWMGLTPQDRRRSIFAMNADTLKKAINLKDSNGIYVLHRHTSHPLKSTILGQPYTLLESIPGVLASTKDSVLLVDSSFAKEATPADDSASDAEIAVAVELIWPGGWKRKRDGPGPAASEPAGE